MTTRRAKKRVRTLKAMVARRVPESKAHKSATRRLEKAQAALKAARVGFA